MVQPSGKGLNLAFRLRGNFYRATGWRVFREAEMCAVLMVIDQVRGHQSFEMSLIEDDHVVQQNRVGNFPPSVQQHRSATDSERPYDLAELRCASPPKLHRPQTLRRGRIARTCAAGCRPMLLAVVVQAKEHWGFASRCSAGSYAGHGR
jgi:hypothetical protein